MNAKDTICTEGLVSIPVQPTHETMVKSIIHGDFLDHHVIKGVVCCVDDLGNTGR